MDDLSLRHKRELESLESRAIAAEENNDMLVSKHRLTLHERQEAHEEALNALANNHREEMKSIEKKYYMSIHRCRTKKIMCT